MLRHRIATIVTATIFAISLGVVVVSAQDVPQTGASPESSQPVVPEGPQTASPTVSGGVLNVVGVVPLKGDALSKQIIFFFDRPISADSPENPFAITPPLPGNARKGENFIAYDIAGTELLEERYEVRLSPELRSADGALLNPEHGVHTFTRSLFRVERVWLIEGKPQSTILGLLFSFPVNIEDVRPLLSVLGQNDAPVPFTLEEGTTPNTMRLSLSGVLDDYTRIVVEKGLKDSTGKLETVFPFTYVKTGIARLEVKSIKWGHVYDYEQQIQVVLSSPVNDIELRDHFELVDQVTGKAVPFNIWEGQSGDDLTVSLNLDPTYPIDVKATVKKGLQSTDELVLAEDYSKALTRQPSPLQIEQTYWWRDWSNEGLSKDGLVLAVSLNKRVRPSELKEHLEITPAVQDLRVEAGYDREMRIYGQWDSKKQYVLLIKPGLKDVGGKVLEKEIRSNVLTREVPAYVGFGHEGEYYFPRRSGIALELETRNVSTVKVELHRMFPGNLAVALEDLQDGKGSPQFNASWCEKVGETEVAVAETPDRIVQTPLDLDRLFPQNKLGVFCLTVQGDRSARNSKAVLFTNMGVLAHWQDEELALFVHDLVSLAPVPKARVSVYSSKNQLLAAGNADEKGIAHLGPFDTILGTPRVAVVENEGDYTFIKLDRRVDGDESIPAEWPAFGAEKYQAFVYADRDLYRPGETVHAQWLVRQDNGDALPEVPLVVKVLKPNGRPLLLETATLSAFGTGGLDIATQRIHPTGRYSVQLMVPGSDTTIGTYAFSLEDFVPNRMKAEVKLDQALWKAGSDYAVTVHAQHLFGAPAADRKGEVQVVFRGDAIVPGGPDSPWKSYRFGNDSEFTPDFVPLGESQTDAEGKAAFTFSYKPPADLGQPMMAVVQGRVFEVGGRPVTGKAEILYYPSDLCLGLHVSEPESGTGMLVDVAAVTPEGAAAAVPKVLVTLEKQRWNYYVRRYMSHYESKWSESFEPVETLEAAIADGRGSVAFTPSGYGYYRIRVHADGTPQYSTQSFYCYDGRYRAVDTARPSLIKVALDKESYLVGDTAEVRIESPFDGQGIIVVQRDKIREVIPVEIRDKVGVVRLSIERSMCPNVWLEATVIHTVKTDRTQMYPFSSFAAANLAVRDTTRNLDVQLVNLPVEFRPLTDAQFEIQVRDSAGAPVVAELTLAAVDEGIHGITNYKSPDPYEWLFRPRRPDFRRAHYYDKVAYDFAKPSASGGAARFEEAGAAIGENWIRPVALWSGTVRTDEAGRAMVTMNLPEFNGQLRLDAVAASPGALGAKSGNVFVRRPYMLRTSLPRFMLPGDQARCRGSVFNQTDGAVRAAVTWTADGARLLGSGGQTIDVPAHGEASFEAALEAGRSVGQGQIAWEVVVTDAAGVELERLSESDPMPVRAPGAFQSNEELVVLEPGESREFRNTLFLDDVSARIEITVSPSPMLRLDGALRYLVGYPYGCVEQTVSRLLPMYLLRESKAITGRVFQNVEEYREGLELDNYLDSGIRRLFAMQTAGGGLAMWPGGVEPYSYGSVYALHFLTLVKSGRAIELQEDAYEALQKYVWTVVRGGSTTDANTLYERAYAVYTLALGGDAEAVREIERFDTIEMPTQARYLLAAALAMNTQDKDRVGMYLASKPMKDVWGQREISGALNSDIRNKAVIFLAEQHTGGSPEALQKKADELLDYLKNSRSSWTTQETAFVVSALVPYLQVIGAAMETAAATVAGPEGESAVQGADAYTGQHAGPGGLFRVTNSGGVRQYAHIVTRGFPATAGAQTEAVSEGITVTRRVLMPDSTEVEGSVYSHMVGYVVELTIDAPRDLENIIVSDHLPAGFEVDNPRLDTDALVGTDFEGAATPSNLDLRDDRLLIGFDRIDGGSTRFYYIVRAVTPGTFTYPALEGECMYDPSVRASTASANITIE